MKMFPVKPFFIIIFNFFLLQTWAQNNPLEDQKKENILDEIENILPENIENIEIGEWLDFDFLDKNNLLNINNLDKNSAFEKLYLSDFQYYHLKKYISDYGALVSFTELKTIQGFDSTFISKIIPFIYLGEAESNKKKHIFKYWKQQLRFNYFQILEKKKGYEENIENAYMGGPQQYKLFYSLKNDYFSFGFATLKRASEPLFNKEYAYLSGHLQIKNLGILQSLIIGDYRLSLGQGGGVGNSFYMNNDIISQRRNQVLSPVSSTSNMYLMRGLAINLGNYKYNTTLFFSNSKDPKFLSYGAHFSTLQDGWKLGGLVTINHSEGNKKISLINYNIDYQYYLQKFIFYGELGFTNHLGWMNITGISARWNTKISSGILFRYYSSNYSTLLGNGPLKSTTPNNEIGATLATDIALNRQIKLVLSTDFAYFNKLLFRTQKPSKNIENKAILEYQIKREHLLTVQYHSKIFETDKSGTFYYKIINKIHHQRVKIRYFYTINALLKCKTEIQVNRYSLLYENNHQWGYLLFQDFIFNISNCNLSIKNRIAFFNTSTYEERNFAFEDDLSQNFSITSYFYKGIRYYLVIRYKYKFITLEGKIARTLYFNKDSIGDGLEKIENNSKTELKMQIIFKF